MKIYLIKKIKKLNINLEDEIIEKLLLNKLWK